MNGEIMLAPEGDVKGDNNDGNKEVATTSSSTERERDRQRGWGRLYYSFILFEEISGT